MARKKFTVEQAFEELDAIVEELEKEETSINDALKLYTKGVKLVKRCQDSLDAIEKELIILEETGGPPSPGSPSRWPSAPAPPCTPAPWWRRGSASSG